MVAEMKQLLMSRRGLFDFIVQRLTAVILGIYVIHLMVVAFLMNDLNFQSLQTYLGSPYTMILTSLVLVSVAAHAWIGMWTIGTDYLRQYSLGKAADVIRLLYQSVLALALLAYLAWSLWLVWV